MAARNSGNRAGPAALFGKAIESIKSTTDSPERAKDAGAKASEPTNANAASSSTQGHSAEENSIRVVSPRNTASEQIRSKGSHSNSDNSQWDSSTDCPSEPEGIRSLQSESINRQRWADMEEADVEYSAGFGHACDTPSPSASPQWSPRRLEGTTQVLPAGMFSPPPVVQAEVVMSQETPKTPVVSQMRASAADFVPPGMTPCPPPPPMPPPQQAVGPLLEMPGPMHPAPAAPVPPARQAPMNSPPLQAPSAPLQLPITAINHSNNPPLADMSQAPPTPTQLVKMWYRVSFLGGLELRTEPHFSAPRTGVTLQHNELFLVTQEMPGIDGRVYLRLADGRGWAFDDSALIPHDPSVVQGHFVPTPVGTPMNRTQNNSVPGTPVHSQTHSVPSTPIQQGTPMTQPSMPGTPMQQAAMPGTHSVPGTPMAQPSIPGTPMQQQPLVPSMPIGHATPINRNAGMQGMTPSPPAMHGNPSVPAPPPPPPPPTTGMHAGMIVPGPPLLQAPSPAPAPAPPPPPTAPPRPQLNSAAPPFNPNQGMGPEPGMPQPPMQQWNQDMPQQLPPAFLSPPSGGYGAAPQGYTGGMQ